MNFLNPFLPLININTRTFYCLLLAVWLLLSISFIATLPLKNTFGYDTVPHVSYSKLIRAEKKLPGPYDDWQTYQPPAYYIINQFFSPFSKNHLVAVRLCSVAYGILFLVACHLVMNFWGITRSVQLLVLIYFMSIPSFLYLFTAYSNDALAMAIAALVPAVALIYHQKPRTHLIVLLFLLSALGVYTKYSLVLLYAAIGCVLAGGVLLRRIQIKQAFFIVIPLFLGCMTLLPYMQFHNFAHTGKYLPSNADMSGFVSDWDIRQTVGSARFFCMPPGITTGEWTYPYAFDENFHASLEPVMFYWTKKTFLSSILSTSLFGEFNYSTTIPSADSWAWLTLWVHIIVLINISYFDKRNQALTAFLLASLVIFALFIMLSNHTFNSVNFRLCAWINVPLTALAATTLNRRLAENNTKASILLSGTMILGIFSHVFYQFTLNTSLP